MINKKLRQLIARVRGFTLIETLVAVLILAVSITGPLTIASKGMQAALIAKDQITAYYLAQDAVEYVRWVRDSNALYNSTHPGALTWLAGLDGTTNPHTNGGTISQSCMAPNSICTIDSLGDTVTTCPSGVCGKLYYDATNKKYTYSQSGTSATIYNRTVQVTAPVGTNANEAQVVVKVYWQDTAGNTHPPLTVYENLYNWQ